MSGEVTFRFETDTELEQKLASMLRKQGWQVQKGVAWETPKDICNRFKIHTPQTLTMRLKRYRGSIIAERGPSGRIIRMQVDPELEKWFHKLNGQ